MQTTTGTDPVELTNASGDELGSQTEAGQTEAGQTQAESQVATGASDDVAVSGSVPQTAPAAAPRTVVSPEIVGVMNGQLTFLRDGSPAPDVAVDLLASDEAGTVGDVVASTVSDADGRYGFDVADGCYAMVFTAPEGYGFPGVGSVLTGPSICVTAETPFSLGASLEAIG